MSFGRGRFSRSSCAGAVSLVDDLVAEIDALIADVDARTGDQFLDLALRLPAEIAKKLLVPLACPSHPSPRCNRKSLSLPPLDLAMLDDGVDNAVVLGLGSGHVVVAIHVLSRLSRCPGLVCLDMISSISRLRLITSRAWISMSVGWPVEARGALVDQDLRVRQRHALPGCSAGEDDGSHRHRHPDADRLNVGLDELDRVVDRESGVDDAARRVDVDRDVLVRILGLERSSCATIRFMIWSSTGVPRKMIRSLSRRE